MKTYWVYILANRNRRIYTGVTSDLERRLWEHRNHVRSRFASQYNIDRLVFIEEFSSPDDAIARERQLKRWSRSKKLALVEAQNPEWRDLSDGWQD